MFEVEKFKKKKKTAEAKSESLCFSCTACLILLALDYQGSEIIPLVSMCDKPFIR